MKSATIAILAALTLGAGSLHAIETTLDLGPSENFSEIRVLFSELNGIPLAGQSFGLDITFKADQFVRIYSVTDPFIDLLLNIETNAGGFPGFPGDTIGSYARGEHGKRYHGAIGRGSGDDGSMTIGLFPFSADKTGAIIPGLKPPVDFYTVHYDLEFPVFAGAEVTGALFGIFSHADTIFGIGPNIPKDIVHSAPDGGSTLMLLGMALGGLGFIRWCNGTPSFKGNARR